MRSQPRLRSRAELGSRKASTAPKRGSGDDCPATCSCAASRENTTAKNIGAMNHSPRRSLVCGLTIPFIKSTESFVDGCFWLIAKQVFGLLDIRECDHRFGGRQ